MTQNRSVIFASRPTGAVTEETFRIENKEIPKLQKDGDVLVKVLYLSVDPYMRGRMKDSKSYVPPFEVGKPLSGYGTGQVTESKSDKFKVGDIISGFGFEYSEYIVLNDAVGTITKVHESLSSGKIPLSQSLSTLGMPGMTAYIGLLHVGQYKNGDNVLVTAAAGAVGSMVGQIAKIKGSRVVGVAGSDEKVQHIKDKFRFDEGFNYKTTDYNEGIQTTLPNGVDLYFDNVGGDALDAAIINLNTFGRIVLCGAISQYNEDNPPTGPRVTPLLIGKAGRMEGFIVGYYSKLFPQASDDMAKWIQSGELKIDETVKEGIENLPQAFIGLMNGENLGKMIVKVADL